MATSGTPSHRYKWRTSPKDLKKSYEVRLSAQFGGHDAQRRLDNYNRMIRERKMAERGLQYVVNGKAFTIYQMMEYIIAQVSSGESLPDVCNDPGMPDMKTIYSWFDNHPEFERDYYRAEEIRGHRMGEEALEVARRADRVNVNAQKLTVETLSKFAARSNRRFQDKQVIEKPDEFANLTIDQIHARIARMLEANPSLAGALGNHPLLASPSAPETESQLAELVPPIEAPGALQTLSVDASQPIVEAHHLEDAGGSLIDP